MQVGERGFALLLERGLFDVVMPDVKYAGGYSEMLKIAVLAHKHGIECSPHNPTGPVCNMASMHLLCASDHFSMLEFQLGESDLFFDVVGGKGPGLLDGCFEAPRDVPGLGLQLDDAVLAEHRSSPCCRTRSAARLDNLSIPGSTAIAGRRPDNSGNDRST
jgi:galactonate dehydratase